MRSENRKEDALRPVEIITNYTSNPDGSVLIACGNTKVLCTAIIEEKVPSFLRGSGRGWVTSEYSLLPGSTVGRTVREASRGKVSGRTSEIQRLIGRSLRSIIDMEALGEKTVWIDCDVIQADGGTRTASITGGYAALYIASRKLVSQGKAAEALCRDAVAAVSVGIIDGRAVLDLDYAEDSRADVDMNVIMTGSGDFVEIQGTAEGKTFTADELREMLRLAKKGIMELIEFQNQAIAQIELK
ncbi:MAG: ribonuclease PH [Syntrophomonadaceae bacterium]|nr:ribonuclease PH [Syntrophomonadaceae bacterium]